MNDIKTSTFLFITGKLAAKALEKCLAQIKLNFQYNIIVLNCTVAAFMNAEWIADHLRLNSKYDRIIIPGLCNGDISAIEKKAGIPVSRGPKDLKDLPVYFGEKRELRGYGSYDIQIIAEIVDAHNLTIEEILSRAEYFKKSGADIIDLGCPVNGEFVGVEDAVNALKEKGYSVSLDTFDSRTALRADRAGLDMLLSINSINLELARDLDTKVVVIPDFGKGLDSLEENASKLEKWGISFVMDPILDPLCMGFTESINSLIQLRKKYPENEIMIGLGNVTELTDADSIGINALMTAVAVELGINYLLTTEVISWAKGAVRELDLARRLMHYARENHVPPKRINDSLIALKDPPFDLYSEGELQDMQKEIEDRNYRIFIDGTLIHLFNRDTFISGSDPQEIFNKIDITDPSHAFYLGKELERAALAIRLGKKYVQEEPLRWGYL